MWPIEDMDEVVFDGAHKLLTEGVVHLLKHVERDCFRVVSVAEGCCFESSGTCQDDKRCSGIGRGHDLCCQECCIDSGG